MEDNTVALETCIDQFRALRLTAQSFGVKNLEKIAALGEQIASKAALAQTQFRMKNCVDALWDATTTVAHVLSNGLTNTSDEQKILILRLEKQLRYVVSLQPDEAISEMKLEVPADWSFDPIE